MEDKASPLTVLKQRISCTTPSRYRVSSSSSSLSSLSYPQIPSRCSSLSASIEYDSSEVATSTRTPSLSDSLYKIDVVKIRQGHAAASRHIRKTGLDVKEDPFVDNTPRRPVDPRGGLWTQSGYQLAPQLLVRWSSGSYGAIEPCISPKPTTPSAPLEAPVSRTSEYQARMCNAHSLSSIMHEGPSELLCPLNGPVSFASMKSYACWPSMGADYMSVWASVNVSADVEPIALPETLDLAPLDMIILFGSLKQPSVSILTSMVLASSILASNLVADRDRIAMACVDGSARNGFELLLPLGFHAFETSRTALNTFSLRQLKRNPRRCPDVSNSIRQVSRLFHSSPRAAFSHLMFISADPPENLFICGVDPAIGFHTISPQLSFPLDTADHPLGWHIFYDANADDPRSREAHFMRKVFKVVRHLRTGLNSGMMTDLRMSLDHGFGCRFESAIEASHLARLRPGETWTVKVRIGVPIEIYQETQLNGHPMFDDLIRQINNVLKAYSSQPTAQDILSARLEYQHSLMPAPHNICLETHCTISRTTCVPLSSSSDFGNISRLASYEMDDEAISIGLGSASGSS